ncbi:MAG: zinc-binding dehydrogenase [Chloroflexota bacterium]
MSNTTSIEYASDGTINIVELPVADPGPGELQLTGGACGICSWDVNTAKLGSKMVPMAPPGHEGVGYVTKVGPDVTGFKEGDRVAAGGFAQLRNVSTARAYPIPDSDLADEYWIVEPVSCAVTGIDRSNLSGGDRVAVIGTGFMGLLLIQGLLRHPLDALIAIDINQDRLDLAKNFGVGETYNPLNEDVEELTATLKAREFDVVIDSSGSQQGLDLATDIVKHGGILNLFGWIKGERASFNPTKWHLRGLTIVNSAPASRVRETFPPAIRLINQGVFDLRKLVTHVVPLDEYPSLMTSVLDGDPSYIKGVVKHS